MFLKIPFQVALKQYQKNKQKINPTTRFISNILSFLLLKRTKQRKQSTLLVPYKHRNLQSHAFLQTYNAILPTSLTSFALSNQRLFTLETCCGYQYDSFGKNKPYLCFQKGTLISTLRKGKQLLTKGTILLQQYGIAPLDAFSCQNVAIKKKRELFLNKGTLKQT